MSNKKERKKNKGEEIKNKWNKIEKGKRKGMWFGMKAKKEKKGKSWKENKEQSQQKEWGIIKEEENIYRKREEALPT